MKALFYYAKYHFIVKKCSKIWKKFLKNFEVKNQFFEGDVALLEFINHVNLIYKIFKTEGNESRPEGNSSKVDSRLPKDERSFQKLEEMVIPRRKVWEDKDQICLR